jgi:alpha-beta hydrolase superfamily lysophospholipase
VTQAIQLDPDVPDRSEAFGASPGAREEYVYVDNQFATIDGVLRWHASARSPVVVIQTHPRRTSAKNLSAWPCRSLAAMGVDTFAYNNRATNSAAGTEVVTVWEDLALDVAAAVSEMRQRGYKYVVLYGQSAGGPLVSYYQNVAENGNEVFPSRGGLSGFLGYNEGTKELRLPSADALILQNATTGTGYSFLMRLDGSVADEDAGTRDPLLDPFSEANGFDVLTGEGHYTAEFRRTYAAAQASRMNRLIQLAEKMLERCRGGAGTFLDDEILIVRGIRGELSCVDLNLASQTTEPRVIYPSGQREIIRSKRRVVPHYATRNARFRDGGTVHTLRSFLSYRAIRADPETFDPDAATAESSGVDFASSNSTTAGNLAGTSVPLLITASTADTQVHLPSAELAFNAAVGVSDKSIAFIEGAEHDMTSTAQALGDTRATHLDVLTSWLAQRFL